MLLLGSIIPSKATIFLAIFFGIRLLIVELDKEEIITWVEGHSCYNETILFYFMDISMLAITMVTRLMSVDPK